MHEGALLTGPLEPTNEPYAIAKIAGIKMCAAYNQQYGHDYRSVMPTNLYGPGDNFHPENSHVIPGLLRRFREAIESDAQSVSIWGSGRVKREFLYVDDMATACCHVMALENSHYRKITNANQNHINIGTGVDCTIAQLAESVREVSGYRGELIFDTSKPDGAPRKLLDVTAIEQTGWRAATSLNDGLKLSWNWYLNNIADGQWKL